VGYEFQALGQPQEGWRATSTRWLEPVSSPQQAPSAALQALADQLTHQWHSGQPVAVHHHPQDPGQSYLHHRADPGLRRGLWMGGALLASGLALLGWGLRAGPRSPAA
jgi:hypothetical protein